LIIIISVWYYEDWFLGQDAEEHKEE